MEQEKKNQNGAQELSVGDQIKVRREKLANLQAEGHNPFEITKFVQTTNSREIRENFDAMEGKPVSIAGRRMSKRGMGKVSFCDLQDKEGRIQVSGVGEILAAADFYDYDAKYNNPQSETDTNPVMDENDRELIREAAATVFDAVDGYSLARVDFFLTAQGPVFNELNTLPGFTAISMYPQLWEARGVSKKQLIQDLIDTAYTRHTDDTY